MGAILYALDRYDGRGCVLDRYGGRSRISDRYGGRDCQQHRPQCGGVLLRCHDGRGRVSDRYGGRSRISDRYDGRGGLQHGPRSNHKLCNGKERPGFQPIETERKHYRCEWILPAVGQREGLLYHLRYAQ